MLPQNPGYANHAADTPPFDPEFDLDAVILAAQRALAALRRGDMTAACEFASYAAVFVTDAQRHLAVIR
ncbi:Uncharacterised protein [Mycobacteroides abscessus subsp. abscessus]|uniref:hypothetical protein n=1 Tax=Mycobacteroides abscessus TaxID=36809 RepID=UPI000929137C|nr:hypothetical protein [Mycobacteroides abscessus]SHP28930.1 Uncharacterised protein [Mycobacteroides abscessus subsp. abscessus]SHP69155.1 Uncharacterised protein [Mycobacteroides abscessus subsp. abscessus]SHY39429.1 Uncharacterised protein [Mycobacteroides abscessus subsp. abscessus]SKD93259.1 Uncharacterised protein [Mycobacteroides abscessus subsp. abscessus]